MKKSGNDNFEKQHFSFLLRRWRDRESLTQAKAAQVLGISLRTYQKWEQAMNSPSPLAKRQAIGLISGRSSE